MTNTDHPPPPDAALALWQSLAAAHAEYISLRMRLFAEHREDLVAVAAVGVASPTERSAALELATLLPSAETLPLLPALLELCSTAYADRAWSLILAMPRSEVVAAIQLLWDRVVVPHEGFHVHNLVGLFRQLDPALSERLMAWAGAHPDPEIRSVAGSP
jgi:hypothetical protein